MTCRILSEAPAWSTLLAPWPHAASPLMSNLPWTYSANWRPSESPLNVGDFALMPESNGPTKYTVGADVLDMHQVQTVADCVALEPARTNAKAATIPKADDINKRGIFTVKISVLRFPQARGDSCEPFERRRQIVRNLRRKHVWRRQRVGVGGRAVQASPACRRLSNKEAAAVVNGDCVGAHRVEVKAWPMTNQVCPRLDREWLLSSARHRERLSETACQYQEAAVVSCWT